MCSKIYITITSALGKNSPPHLPQLPTLLHLLSVDQSSDFSVAGSIDSENITEILLPRYCPSYYKIFVAFPGHCDRYLFIYPLCHSFILCPFECLEVGTLILLAFGQPTFGMSGDNTASGCLVLCPVLFICSEKVSLLSNQPLKNLMASCGLMLVSSLTMKLSRWHLPSMCKKYRVGLLQ